MIVGHWGLTYAVSAKIRNAPIVLFAVAAIAPDCLDAIYSLMGLCSAYGVYSHSLPVALPLALVAAAFVWLITRNRAFAFVAMALVLSHLPLDWVTGRKALMLHGPLVGAELYRRPLADFFTELPLLVGGWWVARRAQLVPRWAIAIPTVLILAMTQAVGDSMNYLNLKKPASSQNAACRATWPL